MNPTSCTLTTILVSYNTRHLLDECLAALKAASATLGETQVIVVDNASRDGSAEHLEQHHPEAMLIRSPTNVGFGRANNLALPFVKGQFVLLLNTDAFIAEDSLTKSLAFLAAHPRCGIVGARLVGRDGEEQPSARRFPTPLNIFLKRSGLHRQFRGVPLVDGPQFVPPAASECDWVPGCYYLIRREVIQQVGLFDARFFLYYEEVDHCLAAKRAGWSVVCDPSTSVVHIGGESAKSDGRVSSEGRQVGVIEIESAFLYFRKNFGAATVILHLVLDVMADLLIALKSGLNRSESDSLGFRWRRIKSTVGLCFRTRLGSSPTR